MPSCTSLLAYAALAVCSNAMIARSPSLSQALLPKPTGPHQVGLTIAELIDYKRTQPFIQDVEPVKLMISVFYPVTGKHHSVKAAYFPPETALVEDIELSELFGLAAPNGTFEKLALQLVSADPAQKSKSSNSCEFPLVIFMPGQGTTRLFYSHIASNIASLGYVVVTIDAPYDVDIVQYTDCTVANVNFTLWGITDQVIALEVANAAIQTRVEDVSFVLDSLSNATFANSLIPNLPSSGLNTTHVAMVGHSLGGVTAYTMLGANDRIIGGLNMDGDIFGPGVPAGTTKPFMLMGQAGHTRNNTDDDPESPTTWQQAWANLTGWKRDIVISGTGHYDFSDYPTVFEALEIFPSNATVMTNLGLGTMKGKRALEIVTKYVGAFLAFVVHGKKSKLLDGPVKEFPEVMFDY